MQNLQTRLLQTADQQIIIETFVTSSFFILVYEANTYNLLVQRNFFQKQSPIASIQNVFCQYAANLQEETQTEIWFQKNFQNTFLEEHLWGIGFGFYIICFGASNK